MLRIIAFLLFLLASPMAMAAIDVKDVRLGLQEGGATRFVLELNQAADYRLFFLAHPARLVLDLPALNWPQDMKPAARGLVNGWRSGQFGEGTRVVLDLAGGAKPQAIQLLPATGEKGPRLVVDLQAAKAEEFAGLIGRVWGSRAQQSAEAMAASTGVALRPPSLPDARRPAERLPLIVIDAGHGGVDPGAIAANGRYEKDITLAVARKLAAELQAGGRYRVALTRNRDVFIPLQDRVKIARRQAADLFISLHADSVRNRDVRGATVYTLSTQASDKEAAELAESENRADELAGLPRTGDDDLMADILTSMSYRASVNGGHSLSREVVKSLRASNIQLTERPERSAGFAVLKAPDIPSVLVEMGYVTSRQDAALLGRAEHQAKLAEAIANAVDVYFSKRRPDATGVAEARAILTGTTR